MIKQLEILEGIRLVIKTQRKNGFIGSDDYIASLIYNNLHSQGVVIKVGGGVPELEHLVYLKAGITKDEDLSSFAKAIEVRTKSMMLKAGYTQTEPLIKEE